MIFKGEILVTLNNETLFSHIKQSLTVQLTLKQPAKAVTTSRCHGDTNAHPSNDITCSFPLTTKHGANGGESKAGLHLQTLLDWLKTQITLSELQPQSCTLALLKRHSAMSLLSRQVGCTKMLFSS